MRTILLGVLVLVVPATASAKELVYEGTWLTTNRKLDGTMTCVVTNLGGQKWAGTFSGVWEGVPFSYKVQFSGPPEKVRGQAQINGAFYEWTGEMDQASAGRFRGQFRGSRYLGSFSLKRKGN